MTGDVFGRELQRLRDVQVAEALRVQATRAVEQTLAEVRRWFGGTQSGLAVAAVVERAMWTAFGCTCRWHSAAGPVYVEDVTCPMHGTVPGAEGRSFVSAGSAFGRDASCDGPSGSVSGRKPLDAYPSDQTGESSAPRAAERVSTEGDPR